MVVATAVPEKVPNTLSIVAITSALRGDSTRVVTTVAIEFGASVHPLTNSAQRIRSNTTIRRMDTCSMWLSSFL